MTQLDGAQITFEKYKVKHVVAYVPYNTGVECISDYTISDKDDFVKVLEKFMKDWEPEAIELRLVQGTKKKDLPLLIGSLVYPESLELLEKLLKG